MTVAGSERIRERDRMRGLQGEERSGESWQGMAMLFIIIGATKRAIVAIIKIGGLELVVVDLWQSVSMRRSIYCRWRVACACSITEALCGN